MKKWYLFYSSSDIFSEMAHTIEDSIDLNSLKLQQVGAEISENQKLHQAGAEIEFPAIFGFVPWRHHLEIVTKCKSKSLPHGRRQEAIPGRDDGFIYSGKQAQILHERFQGNS
ncbi:MAG: hypothetical protein PUB10_10410 [Clostridiales bacterium]|nr:hypothetical protein [Clostridiales bacterium]